jgi:hypothetical protein
MPSAYKTALPGLIQEFEISSISAMARPMATALGHNQSGE